MGLLGGWSVSPIVVTPSDLLGLASHYPPLYWLGLTIVLVGSVFAYLDQDIRDDAPFIALLFALAFILVGVPQLAVSNPPDPSSYYPNSESLLLLQTGHLDIANAPVIAYYAWPATHFISATLMAVAGVDLGSLIRYGPLLIVFFVVVITYSLGKRFHLGRDRCFLISFLVLSSLLVSAVGDYAPRTIGGLLFLVLTLIVVPARGRNTSMWVAALLVFTGLVLSHGLYSVAALLALSALYFYRRQPRFIVLAFTVFLAWIVFEASAALSYGYSYAITIPFSDILRLIQAERYVGSGPARGILQSKQNFSRSAIATFNKMKRVLLQKQNEQL